MLYEPYEARKKSLYQLNVVIICNAQNMSTNKIIINVYNINMILICSSTSLSFFRTSLLRHVNHRWLRKSR